ncbi:MAG: recombinase family protein [Planctomycetota bacterium]
MRSNPKPNEGLFYINTIRCSNLSQSDTSPDGQKAVNDAWSLSEGMVFVDDFFAEGVSGSQTFNREDIEALLSRKRERNDFNAIVVFELSRLTRGGTRHGLSVEDRLRKAGIRLLSSTDNIPDGPEGDLIKSVKHYANQLQARSISLAAARGLAQSLEKDQRPGASRTPYGFDRLYRGPDGKPRMLTRWDGRTQIWFKPDGDGKPLEEVGRAHKPPRREPNAKFDGKRRQRFRGYKKQEDEVSELVLGSQDRQAAVALMFTAYDLWGWGYDRVTRELRDKGIPAPEGGRWTIGTVVKMLANPIYLGIEVRHRYTNALYHKLSPEQPIPVHIDQDQLAAEGRRQVPRVERPRDEWKLVDKPSLKDMLPASVRPLTMARILKKLDTDRPPHPRQGKSVECDEPLRHKHTDSPFLLTRQLHSAQTGKPMRGDTVHKKLKSGPRQYRYYFDGSAATFAERGLLIRRVPAEPLEQAVVGVLRNLLVDLDDLDERIANAISNVDQVTDHGQEREALQAERSTLVARLRDAYRLLGGISDELADELNRDSERIQAIDRQLASLEAPTKSSLDPTATANAVRELIASLNPDADLPNAIMKQLIAAMLSDMTIDLETFEVSFTVIIPPLATEDDDNTANEDIADSNPAVRLASRLPSPLRGETNRSDSLRIANYRCQHRLEGRRHCFTCRRTSKAA